MATTKAKTKSRAKKPSSSAAKTTSKKPAAKAAIIASPKKPKIISRIFCRKFDNKAENILTIFHSPKIIGALLAELIGVMIISMVLLATGSFSNYFDAQLVGLVILGVSLAVFAVSGANLNPIITIGLMATRRIAPIRGVLYIIAQILGAWVGYVIVGAFAGYDPELGTTLPTMITLATSVEEGTANFWPITLLEFLGAAVIGFFFVRALVYKRSAFTFAVLVAGGYYVAFTLGLYITAGFMGLQEHGYIYNPAVAIMYQILPTTGVDFGDLMAKIGLALATFVLAPTVGATIGFYLSDVSSAISDTPTEL